MFSHMEFVDEIIGLEYLNTENVTDMSGMFNGSYQLQSLDLSNFNTSKVTDMSYMFCDCGALTSLDLKRFNIGNVTTVVDMFKFCSRLATIYCYDNWQKTGLISSDMFYGCHALKGAVEHMEGNDDASMANPDTGYFSRYAQVAIDRCHGQKNCRPYGYRALLRA